jgi:cysteine synthase B
MQLRKLVGENSKNTVLVKLEGFNPTLSVKARAAFTMIIKAQERGRIKPGDTLIEATSGNTGIALCAAASSLGYKMVIIMPSGASDERKQSMTAYGATLIDLTGPHAGMESARDLALKMQAEGKGIVLDQFNNEDNVEAHFSGTGPEIWRDTSGTVTHFVSSMGTTGTIMGVSKYLKSKNSEVRIIGCQPVEGAKIPGIRKWPKESVPGICDFDKIDRMIYVSQEDAEETARALALKEGLFVGISAGGAVWCALELCRTLENATIVVILPDWGDRYLSTGVFAKYSDELVIEKVAEAPKNGTQ